MFSSKTKCGYFMVFFLICFLTAAGWGCVNFNHVWKTLLEEKSGDLNEASLEIFLEGLNNKVQGISSGTWGVLNTGLENASNTDLAFKRIFEKISSGTWKYYERLPFFNDNWASAPCWSDGIVGMVCLDVREKKRKNYLWLDEAAFNPCFIRCGETNDMVVRVMCVNPKGDIDLIDEMSVADSLEWDFLFPSINSVGGVWLRRISRKRPELPAVREWLVSVPMNPQGGPVPPVPSSDTFYFSPSP